LETLSRKKKENDDDSGFIYEAHDLIRDILTKYNDTIRGRCAICLENFVVEE
jgi:hypothetical protein